MVWLIQQSDGASIPPEILLHLQETLLADGGNDISTSQPTRSVQHETAALQTTDRRQHATPDVMLDPASNSGVQPHTTFAPTTFARAVPSLGQHATRTMAAATASCNTSQSTPRQTVRARSLQGDYFGGDTQPMESQFYRDYARSNARQSIHEESESDLQDPFNRAQIMVLTGQGSQTSLVDGLERTSGTVVLHHTDCMDQEDGEPGHVDLLQKWPGHDEQNETHSNMDGERDPEEDDYADLLESQNTELRPVEEVECKLPETPAIAGRKHTREGKILNPVVTTKKLSTPQLFGGTSNALTATQMFAQTQEPSSPFPACPPSVSIMTRPSPNIDQRSAALSSPAMTVSSPASAKTNATRFMKTFPRPVSRQRSTRLSTPLRRYNIERPSTSINDLNSENSGKSSLGTRITRRRQQERTHPTPTCESPGYIDLTHSTPVTGRKSFPAFADLLDGDGVDAAPTHDSGDPRVDNDLTLEDEDYVHDPDGNDAVYDEHSQFVLDHQAVNLYDKHDEGDQSSLHADHNFLDATHPDGGAGTNRQRHELIPNTQLSFASNHATPGQIRKPSGVSESESKSHQSSPSLVLKTPLQRANQMTTSPMAKSDTQATYNPTSGGSMAMSLVQNHARDEATSVHDPLSSTANRHHSSRSSSPTSKSLSPRAGRNQVDRIIGTASRPPGVHTPNGFFNETQAERALSEGSDITQDLIDDVMDSVFTAEDQQLFDVLHSSMRDDPVHRKDMTIHKSSRAQRNRPEGAGPTTIQQSDARVKQCSSAEVADLPEETAKAVTFDTNHILRDSPSKANEFLSLVREEPKQVPGASEGVKAHVQAGPHEVPQTLARPSKMSAYTSRQAQTTRPEKAELESKRKGRPLRVPATNVQDLTLGEAKEAQRAQNTVHKETPILQTDTQVRGQPPVVAPERILALFKPDNQYYAGTWLGRNFDGTYQVRFDDGTRASVPSHQVCSLDLRVGDNIKFDHDAMAGSGKDKFHKDGAWVVHELGPLAQTEKEKSLGTDMRGRVVVILKPKPGRNPGSSTEAISILISHVRLTPSMWSQFRDRAFRIPEMSREGVCKAETPAPTTRMGGTMDAPGSCPRRPGLHSTKGLSNRAGHTRDESVHSTDRKRMLGGTFSGMAFAISYGPDEAEKQNVSRLIQQNGGMVLAHGFEELFDVLKVEDTPPVSAIDQLTRRKEARSGTTSSLTVQAEFIDVGFVALIADRHSRTAKYVQALALGLPTLSARWVLDSLDEKKNVPIAGCDPSALPWQNYLLAAGESTYLNGATRSRILRDYPLREARLTETIANRSVLLDNEGVLIVAPKQNRADWEKRKPFVFLTQALGAKYIKRVTDLAEARGLVDSESSVWKWVYVDGSVSHAASVLFGKSFVRKKKKRRDGVVPELETQEDWIVREGDVRVVSGEFVVQSLILGCLLD